MTRQMLHLERDLPQERASRLLDGLSMYGYEALYAGGLSVRRLLFDYELSKFAPEHALRRATSWRTERWWSHRRWFGNTLGLKAGRKWSVAAVAKLNPIRSHRLKNQLVFEGTGYRPQAGWPTRFLARDPDRGLSRCVAVVTSA
jgi:hypothetical protein